MSTESPEVDRLQINPGLFAEFYQGRASQLLREREDRYRALESTDGPTVLVQESKRLYEDAGMIEDLGEVLERHARQNNKSVDVSEYLNQINAITMVFDEQTRESLDQFLLDVLSEFLGRSIARQSGELEGLDALPEVRARIIARHSGAIRTNLAVIMGVGSKA